MQSSVTYVFLGLTIKYIYIYICDLLLTRPGLLLLRVAWSQLARQLNVRLMCQGIVHCCKNTYMRYLRRRCKTQLKKQNLHTGFYCLCTIPQRNGWVHFPSASPSWVYLIVMSTSMSILSVVLSERVSLLGGLFLRNKPRNVFKLAPQIFVRFCAPGLLMLVVYACLKSLWSAFLRHLARPPLAAVMLHIC